MDRLHALFGGLHLSGPAFEPVIPPTMAALTELDVVALDPATVSDTLGVLLKYQDDIARIEGTRAKELLDQVHAEMRAAE